MTEVTLKVANVAVGVGRVAASTHRVREGLRSEVRVGKSIGESRKITGSQSSELCRSPEVKLRRSQQGAAANRLCLIKWPNVALGFSFFPFFLFVSKEKKVTNVVMSEIINISRSFILLIVLLTSSYK